MEKTIKVSAWETAKNTNNNQVTQSFNNKNSKAAIIGSKNKIGDPTITQLQYGVDYPNVFSAISQIETAMIPVNGIMMTIGNYDPAGVPTTERLRITLPAHSVQDKGIISLFGRSIEFLPGEVLTTVTSKIQQALLMMIDDNIGISAIHRPNGSQDSLDITYIDTLNHDTVDIDDTVIGIRIQGEIITQPQQGYGTWDKIGNNNTLVPGTEISIWRRIQ